MKPLSHKTSSGSSTFSKPSTIRAGASATTPTPKRTSPSFSRPGESLSCLSCTSSTCRQTPDFPLPSGGNRGNDFKDVARPEAGEDILEKDTNSAFVPDGARGEAQRIRYHRRCHRWRRHQQFGRGDRAYGRQFRLQDTRRFGRHLYLRETRLRGALAQRPGGP